MDSAGLLGFGLDFAWLGKLSASFGLDSGGLGVFGMDGYRILGQSPVQGAAPKKQPGVELQVLRDVLRTMDIFKEVHNFPIWFPKCAACVLARVGLLCRIACSRGWWHHKGIYRTDVKYGTTCST